MIELFLLLGFGHMLADFPLQGDFLAKAKNHKSPVPGTPWAYALFAHAAICGGFVGSTVFAYTGDLADALGSGIFETFVHFITDFNKNDGRDGTITKAEAASGPERMLTLGLSRYAA